MSDISRYISEEKDIVNHPDHYISDSGIETIDVIEAFTKDLEPFEAYCTGNIIKYICRWKHKNGKEDLKKARWYIDHLLGEHKKKENTIVLPHKKTEIDPNLMKMFKKETIGSFTYAGLNGAPIGITSSIDKTSHI